MRVLLPCNSSEQLWVDLQTVEVYLMVCNYTAYLLSVYTILHWHRTRWLVEMGQTLLWSGLYKFSVFQVVLHWLYIINECWLSSVREEYEFTVERDADIGKFPINHQMHSCHVHEHIPHKMDAHSMSKGTTCLHQTTTTIYNRVTLDANHSGEAVTIPSAISNGSSLLTLSSTSLSPLAALHATLHVIKSISCQR